MVAGYPSLTKSIQERIDDDEFSPTLHYPHRSSYHKGEDGKLAYQEAQRTYRVSVNDGMERFREAVLHDVGLENHPNRDAIFEYAWSEGHSSGFYEVYNHLCELSGLFFCKGKMLIYTEHDLTSRGV